MIDLTTTHLSLSLDNPVLVASGPLSNSETSIRKLFDAGAGGVVTKTITDRNVLRRNESTIRWGEGLANSTTYSFTPIKTWLVQLERLNADGLSVIPSVYAETPERLARLVQLIIQSGCRAVELGVSCPNDLITHQYTISEYVMAVKECCNISVAVKLNAMVATPQLAHQLVQAGADMLSISDTIPGLMVNIETGEIELGGTVGLSGPAIRPIVMNAINKIQQSQPTCTISGIGGIQNAEDVISYLSLGANTVQLHSALVLHGLDRINRIVNDFRHWLEQANLNLQQVVGRTILAQHKERS